jgi:hypothetical protein
MGVLYDAAGRKYENPSALYVLIDYHEIQNGNKN